MKPHSLCSFASQLFTLALATASCAADRNIVAIVEDGGTSGATQASVEEGGRQSGGNSNVGGSGEQATGGVGNQGPGGASGMAVGGMAVGGAMSLVVPTSGSTVGAGGMAVGGTIGLVASTSGGMAVGGAISLAVPTSGSTAGAGGVPDLGIGFELNPSQGSAQGTTYYPEADRLVVDSEIQILGPSDVSTSGLSTELCACVPDGGLPVCDVGEGWTYYPECGVSCAPVSVACLRECPCAEAINVLEAIASSEVPIQCTPDALCGSGHGCLMLSETSNPSVIIYSLCQ